MIHWTTYTDMPGKVLGRMRGCASNGGTMTEVAELVSCPMCRALPSWRRAWSQRGELCGPVVDATEEKG